METTLPDHAFDDWMQALEERHLADLRVQEVTRALRALSSVYVERRGALQRGAALDSAGKRAAFALFYGPLHYLVTRHIVEAMGMANDCTRVVDLGCGTGAAGAAWAVALNKSGGGKREAEGGAHRTSGAQPRVLGIDRHPWAVAEARWTYRAMGLDGAARRDEAARVRLPGAHAAIVAAFTVNELADADRDRLLPRLMRAANEGSHILIVEPIARSIGAWWDTWAAAIRGAGGREDTWRFEAELPERLRMFDRAAGLDHRVLTARSLFVRDARVHPASNDEP
jgi:SAM-dependent methyltransferase